MQNDDPNTPRPPEPNTVPVGEAAPPREAVPAPKAGAAPEPAWERQAIE